MSPFVRTSSELAEVVRRPLLMAPRRSARYPSPSKVTWALGVSDSGCLALGGPFASVSYSVAPGATVACSSPAPKMF